MKKIITVTFHRANNYGAVLQAYALQKFLSKKYETEILDYDNKDISDVYRVFKKPSGSIKQTIRRFKKDILNYNKNSKRSKNFAEFRKKLMLTKKYSRIDDIKENCPAADVYITGSDQIWNHSITGGLDDIYFLNFGDSKSKRIAYGASCGTVDIVKKKEKEFIEKIENIDFLSTRENSFNEYIEDIAKRDVRVVVDPALLLTKKEWEELDITNRIIDEKYIFVYSVGNANEALYNMTNKLAQRTGYKIIYFDRDDSENNYKCEKVSGYKYGPVEFLNLLYNSEYVVTTSFHGLALSTIFNKNFFISLSTYPDRLLTLLELLDLKDRIITNNEKINDVINSDIDWNKVNEKIKQERQKSIDWLINSIEG